MVQHCQPPATRLVRHRLHPRRHFWPVALQGGGELYPGSEPPNSFKVPATYKPRALVLPQLGAGTAAWGDPDRGWGVTLNHSDLSGAFEHLTTHGVGFFDTSETYGYQGMSLTEGSEQLLGAFASKSLKRPIISTKFTPVPWVNVIAGGGLRIGRRAVVESLRNSLTRLGVGYVDLYSIAAPMPYLGGRQSLYEGLADCVELGLCRSVGVCNFNAAQVIEAYAALAKLGVRLRSNQIRFSILNIEKEMDGTIQTCLELGVVPIAHSPLASGLATTKYAHTLEVGRLREKPVGRVGRLTTDKLLRLSTLFAAMTKVANAGKHRAPRTETQVALRFAMAKGCVPIPGVTKLEQAKEVVGALGWELTAAEVQSLSQQSISVYIRSRDHSWMRNL